jgi:hypothetical protein
MTALLLLIRGHKMPDWIADHLGRGITQHAAFGLVYAPQNPCGIDFMVSNRRKFK